MTNAATLTEVAPGVFQVPGSRTNAYLVTEGDELTLIDAGYPGDRDRVFAAIDRLGRRPGDVAAVVLTHGHVDHLGAAGHLRTKHGASVHAHVDEASNVRGEREQRISTGDLARSLVRPEGRSFVWNALRAGGLRPTFVAEVTGFEGDGAALPVPGAPVPVPTPGHTSGHCAFHLPDRAVLVTGDGLVTHDPLTGAIGPRLLAPPLNHDHNRALASLVAFEELDAEVVLPGHGEPFAGAPATAVEAARLAATSR